MFFCKNNFTEIPLVVKNTSSYQIVVSNKDNKSDLYASILQDYIYRISKVKLPIVKDNLSIKENEIVIGNTNRTPYDILVSEEDGFVIKTINNRIFINGGKKKGVLYGVYTFIEDYLGVKKYTNDCEFIPKKATIIIPSISENKQVPAFEYRTTYFLDTENKNYCDFHKLNYFFENRLYPAHSLAWLLPADKYFKEHPEFFALMNGKRIPDQICFSSKGALEEVKKVLDIEIKNTPQNLVWSISHLDNNLTCQCNLCVNKIKKGNGFSDVLIPFINDVAKSFPNKIISTLAYNQSLVPPKNVKPASNVEIIFCMTGIDRKLPLTDKNNLSAEKNITLLNDWKKITPNIFIWDYIANYFNSLSPFPNSNTIKKNLQFYKDNGIKKIFLQGIGPQLGEFSELKTYLTSKLLWNPDLNDKEIINDFCNNFYGSGSPFIIQYLDALSLDVLQTTIMDEYTSPLVFKNDFLSPNNILKYKNYLNNALSAVPKNSIYSKRIMKELLSLEYAEIVIGSASDRKTINKQFNEKILKFADESNKIGVKFLRNGELTPNDFKKNNLQQ